MKVLCTICARGGSEGVKNKNILRLRGKPLIAHSIHQAQQSNLFDTIVVSSDSAKIRNIALQWNVTHVIERPLELATSNAPKLPVVQHAVLETEKTFNQQYDIIIDLDPSSPLRQVNDIVSAFNVFKNRPDALNLVTACLSRRSPYFNLVELESNGFVELSKKTHHLIRRRQDAPPSYDMNASIYIWKRNALFNSESAIALNTLLYVMPEERSIDIDSTLDWKIVKVLARERKDL